MDATVEKEATLELWLGSPCSAIVLVGLFHKIANFDVEGRQLAEGSSLFGGVIVCRDEAEVLSHGPGGCSAACTGREFLVVVQKLDRSGDGRGDGLLAEDVLAGGQSLLDVSGHVRDGKGEDDTGDVRTLEQVVDALAVAGLGRVEVYGILAASGDKLGGLLSRLERAGPDGLDGEVRAGQGSGLCVG